MKLSFEIIVDKIAVEFAKGLDNVLIENFEASEQVNDVLNLIISAHVSSLFFSMKRVIDQMESDNSGEVKKHVDTFIDGMKKYLSTVGLMTKEYKK